jgi:exodeoxyribonuclease VIII
MENIMQNNLSFDDYRKNSAVSQSDLKNLSKCPRFYKYKKTTDEDDTEAMRFGRILHTFVLEHDRFFDYYFVTKKIRKAGKAWEEIIEKANGKDIIFDGELEKVEEIRKNLCKNEYFSMLAEADKEVSFFWKDKNTNVICKARADGYCNKTKVLFDLKTTRDCSEQAFLKQFFSLKYYLQAAFYSDGIKEVLGESPKAFIFFAIEKEPPYLNTTYFLYYESIVIDTGREEYKDLLNIYKKHYEKQDFDIGLEKKVVKIFSMPNWYNFKKQQENNL